LKVIVLPIGEFSTDLIRDEFQAIAGVFTRLGVGVVTAEAVADEGAARQSVETLAQEKPDLLVMVSLRGLSAQVIEAAGRTSPVPCLVWPVQGRFALPSSALGIGALHEAGLPVELVYPPQGDPADNADAIDLAGCILKAARAYVGIRQSRVGVIGNLFPNLVSCRYDAQRVRARLGTTILPIPYEEVQQAIEKVSEQDVASSRQSITSAYSVKTADEQALDPGIRLHLALKAIARENRLDGYAAECWSGLPPRLGLNPCLGFVEDAYSLACEGDTMLCIALLMVRYLTGSSAYVGDLYDVDMDGVVTLIHCGGPASLASGGKNVEIAQSPLALERSFETMTVRPDLAPGPVTILRFYGANCDKLHLAQGRLMGCERSANLTVKVALNGNRWDFLKECFGNHYIVVAGDIRKELELLTKWLGISVIETH
jgi:L-fucose isomerase-like protein